MGTPYASHTEATYENFIAECPLCKHRNVFNRASDLDTFEPIAFRTVICQNTSCARSFNINNDRINPGYEGLLFDCHQLIEAKHYMQAVLSINQAYEMFFSHYLRVEVLYRPYTREGCNDLNELNRLSARLFKVVQSFTFEPMRRLFLALAIRNVGFASLSEGEAWLSSMPSSGRKIPKVTAEKIDSVANADLRHLLHDLASVQVQTVRNRVVHKDAYRPLLVEVETPLKEAWPIIGGLTSLLRLGFDADWYLNHPGR